MPAQRKKEKIAGRYFAWLIGIRNGIYFADGRSNHPHDIGRHSLGTRDRNDAIEQLRRLDLIKAVEFGLADRSVLADANEKLLTLEEGQELYLTHVERPPVLGGVGKSTAKRYRPVNGNWSSTKGARLSSPSVGEDAGPEGEELFKKVPCPRKNWDFTIEMRLAHGKSLLGRRRRGDGSVNHHNRRSPRRDNDS